MWGKKYRAPFQEKIPCKLQVITKKRFKFPGNFKLIFQKAHNRCRGYPPDGMFF